MGFVVEHEIPGRVRVQLPGRVLPADEAAFRAALLACPQVEQVMLYPRIGSVALRYAEGAGAREAVLEHVASIDAAAIEHARAEAGLAVSSGAGSGEGALALAGANSLLMDLAELAGAHFARRALLPAPVAAAFAVWRYGRFLAEALRSLSRSRLDVPVLDAAAIGMSFAKGDPKTASSTMFLLDVGETLEEHTRARSETELIYSLLALPESAQRVEGDTEIAVPAVDLAEGDLVVVRTGMPICVDGTVERGCAMVNQATLTGESLAVERAAGYDVFAGTAVEDGEIYVRVRASAGRTKLRAIVSLVEQSELLKAQAQARRERLADRIVPWNFLLAGVVALATRNLEKTSAALMVDYSCALKLTGSIAVLSAMSQSAKEGFTVKGSKHFEAFAAADTIVFDKTGVAEDEGVVVSDEQRERIERETKGLSALYLAVDGELVGVLGIHDPLKPGVAEAVGQLRELGFSRIVMLIGDSERTAARIAEAAEGQPRGFRGSLGFGRIRGVSRVSRRALADLGEGFA